MTDTAKWVEIIFKFIPAGVITAAGGYMIQKSQSESRRKRMRTQLYREISSNYQNIVVRVALSTSIAGLSEGAPIRFNDKLDVSFSVWNFTTMRAAERCYSTSVKQRRSIGYMARLRTSAMKLFLVTLMYAVSKQWLRQMIAYLTES